MSDDWKTRARYNKKQYATMKARFSDHLWCNKEFVENFSTDEMRSIAQLSEIQGAYFSLMDSNITSYGEGLTWGLTEGHPHYESILFYSECSDSLHTMSGESVNVSNAA
jgi:hypothetical protein